MSLSHGIPRMGTLRLTFLVLAVLALECTGCISNVDGQGDPIDSQENGASAEWPAIDATAVQACMGLDPDELASSLSSGYLEDSTYCETNADCYCLSGSGVPFVGCANAYHARISFAGCYACNECVCIDNTCRQQ